MKELELKALAFVSDTFSLGTGAIASMAGITEERNARYALKNLEKMGYVKQTHQGTNHEPSRWIRTISGKLALEKENA